MKTIVIAAPSQTEITTEETDALKAFVEGGGTLIYLASRTRLHPALHRWLALSSAEVAELVTTPGFEDVGGTTIDVRFQGGVLKGLHTFRVSGERMINVAHEGAIAVTDKKALWWFTEGAGEVWVGSGPDLLENARLELLDNAKFWSAIAARGPIAFDEFHLQAHAASTPINLVTALLQLLVLAALFIWARAPRLGPARDELEGQHRSSLEYVRAMATLTANAKVEGELIGALKDEFRRELEETLGIQRTLSWNEAATELQRRSIPTKDTLDAANETSFLPLSKQLATLSLRCRADHAN